MARFAKLGIGPGLIFDTAKLSPQVRKAVEDGMADAWVAFAELKKRVDVGEVKSGGAFGTRQLLNNIYINRRAGAVIGIYGNSEEEAMYPVYFLDLVGNRLNASNQN